MKFDLKYPLLRFSLIICLVCVGIYAIFIFSPILSLFYIVFILIYSGLQGFHCASCPAYGENCPIFLGKMLQRRFRFRPRARHPTLEFILFTPSLFILFFPQYWLVKTPQMFIIFWVLLFCIIFDLELNICNKCKNFECSLNRNPVKKQQKQK